jgi:hypothetical protein
MKHLNISIIIVYIINDLTTCAVTLNVSFAFHDQQCKVQRKQGLMCQYYILNHIKVVLSIWFSYIVSDPPDGQWGTLHENGYFDGIIGLIQNRVSMSIQVDYYCEQFLSIVVVVMKKIVMFFYKNCIGNEMITYDKFHIKHIFILLY